MTKQETITIHLPADLLCRLDEAVRGTSVTRDICIQQACEAFLRKVAEVDPVAKQLEVLHASNVEEITDAELEALLNPQKVSS